MHRQVSFFRHSFSLCEASLLCLFFSQNDVLDERSIMTKKNYKLLWGHFTGIYLQTTLLKRKKCYMQEKKDMVTKDVPSIVLLKIS